MRRPVVRNNPYPRTERVSSQQVKEKKTTHFKMSKWLKTVPTMTSRKALSTLLLVCHAIIGISGFNMFFNSLKMRSYLRDYMNMSVQGSGAATADAALLALVSIGAVLMVWSVVGSWCIVPERFKRPPCGRCRTCSPIGVAIMILLRVTVNTAKHLFFRGASGDSLPLASI